MNVSRDQLLKLTRRRKTIELAEIGQLHLQELTAGEVVKFSTIQQSDPEAGIYYLIVAGTTDETGKHLFNPDDGDAIKQLPSSVSNAIVDAILEVSGMKKVDEKKV